MTEAIGQLGKTQQQLLRHLLHSPAGASVETLGVAAGISHNAVRQHLTALLAEGFVARGAVQRTGGRPEQLFLLTPRGREMFPRRYAVLAAQLIESVGTELGADRLQAMLRQLGERVGADAATTLDGGAGSAERVAAVARTMNELGYDADVESDAVGASDRIVAHNCVFHHLASQFPQVCQFDLAFLERASGRAVEHAECMVRGGGACRFRFVRNTD